ncbi:MAG: response regulator transcription factor [Sphingomonadaceae bacterium]
MQNQSVHIVVDDPAVRADLRCLLSTHRDLAILSYVSDAEFLADIEQRSAGCVIIDHGMVTCNGLDVHATLAHVSNRLGSIIMIEQGAAEIALRAWKRGALDFIEKPYDPDAVLSAVDKALVTIEQRALVTALSERAQRAIDVLSSRERDVLIGLAEGQANKAIAQELAISHRTVEIYRAKMMAKLNVSSLAEALRIAFAAGLSASDWVLARAAPANAPS